MARIRQERIGSFNPILRDYFRCPVCGSTEFVELVPHGGLWCERCNANIEIKGTCDGPNKVVVHVYTEHCHDLLEYMVTNSLNGEKAFDYAWAVVWRDDKEIRWMKAKDGKMVSLFGGEMANLRGGIIPYVSTGARPEVTRLASESIYIHANTWTRYVSAVLDKHGRLSISVEDGNNVIINVELPAYEGPHKDAFRPTIKASPEIERGLISELLRRHYGDDVAKATIIALEIQPQPTLLEESMRIETRLAAKIIRKALKSKCRTLRVRMARGTAYGWIDVWGSGPFGEFTEEERAALDELGIRYGGNCAVISPEDVGFWVEKLCEAVPEAKALLIAETIGRRPPLEDYERRRMAQSPRR